MVADETDLRLESLRSLAALWRGLQVEQPSEDQRILALRALIQAGRAETKRAAGRLAAAIEESSRHFTPLKEPLAELDFTEHRWVAAHREEAYTDWLAWVVSILSVPQILRVFGVRDKKFLHACGDATEVRVSRETAVPFGHDGCRGRLDLDIDLGGAARLIVEVKVSDADVADTGKHIGYRRSLEHSARVPYVCILLAKNTSDQDYDGFTPRSWRAASLALRAIAVDLVSGQRMSEAVMVLALVAAAEQNLLGLLAVERSGGSSFAHPRTVAHLDAFLRERREKL